MIRTHIFACKIDRKLADSLNRESGRIYTQVMVEQWRTFRHAGHWISPRGVEKLADFYDKQAGQKPLLHAHSVDAAQQGFPKACKTAKACKNIGLNSSYPHKRKPYRSTIWKNTGISKTEDEKLQLALARGQSPIFIELPPNLKNLAKECFVEMRLVYNKNHKFYQWHVVVDDGMDSKVASGTNVIGIDLGEIHPVAATDGETSVVFSARALRSVNQYSNKWLASFQSKISKKKKGSQSYKRMMGRKRKFLAKQARRRKDIEQKVSRAVVDYAVERNCNEIAIGDVRKVANKCKLGKKSNQKVSNWSHGKIRTMIEYKANAEGISVTMVKEHYTSQTCPNPECQHKYKPSGRTYRCPVCGFVGHRDVVGSANILSRRLFGELARVPVKEPKYRFAYRICGRNERSPADTRHVVCGINPTEATSL